MDGGKTGVDIIIPNLNGRHLLAGCLHSIRLQTYGHWHVTVVDNGSSDGSVPFLQQEFPEVGIIALPENTGFSAAVNTGIRAGRRALVFLLNNDTELAEDCLQRLVDAGELLPQFAYFAPKMLNYHQRELLDGAGEGYLRGGAGYRLGTMERDGAPYDCPRQVFGACGGAALYRRQLFADVGLFDEDFFAYLEDVDFNLRASRAGKNCYYVPTARVYHIGSATSGSKFNNLTIRLSTRNSFYLLAKNYPFFLLIRYGHVIVVYQFFWLLFVIKKKQLPPYIAGLTDAVRNVRRMRGKLHRQSPMSRAEISNWCRILGRAEGEVLDSIMRRRMAQNKGNSLLRLYRRLFT
ncbi:glycosyltransferase family 2 protein [Desulfobulbus alkaliphilus]|uniref:glycosyltransferase family 2 protein n=1 Tax=Desulfobulbus alkaliphilus TaxID=869814 RepID=UPI001962ECC9|nr:glycosyltransferase family 2 protein [Desulfobulbus alkaliphilus]MBM9537988.1 glycosyltransferase family 2 protein [Desulfobulbus alkaliphilus]